MEIRGLGVINVQDLFGVASTRSSKRVELVVQLERWEPRREYDRLGLDEERYDCSACRCRSIRMPVAPGRNLAILVEVAARNQLLRARGHHAAKNWRTGSSISCSWPASTTSTSRKSTTCPTPGRIVEPEAGLRAGVSPPGPVHRADGPVRLGQVAGDPRARGSRLLLRRQPADDAHPDARRRWSRRRRHRARRRSWWTCGRGISSRSSRTCTGSSSAMQGLEPGADLPRGHARHAGAALQRDAAAAPARAGPLRRRKASKTNARRMNAIRVDGRPHHRHVGSDGARAAAGVQTCASSPGDGTGPTGSWSSPS